MFATIKRLEVFLTINHYNFYLTILLFVLSIVVLLVGNKFSFWSSNARVLFFKNLVLVAFALSFILFLFYTYCVIQYRNAALIVNLVYNNYELDYLNKYILDLPSLIIVYLCYLVGFISIVTLGDRYWISNYRISVLFLYFIIIVNLLCQSNSIFELFVYYELLLLPSVLFVNKTGYTKKSQQANVYFLLWTQLGSLLVLLGILYISATCANTSYMFIKHFCFSPEEQYCLYMIFFIGFGVKVPLWPLHFWLIKVHVEAPSGFSIFLSGFLVKSAIYCFYKITLVLNVSDFYIVPVVLCFIGMLDASLKMWTQIDIKKLIAYATVQEMNAIYLLFNMCDTWAVNTGLLFLLAHGILSSLMFFIVECLYKRFNSRSLTKIYGVSHLYPNLGLVIWGMLIIFFGLPGTLKFYVEVQLVALLISNDLMSAFFILFIFVVISIIGFARCWFSVLYGHPPRQSGDATPKLDLSSEESAVAALLLFLSIIPCLFIGFI